MKIAIRSLAVALLLTGLVATTHSQERASTQSGLAFVSNPDGSAVGPTPACAPDDPDGCGMGGSKPKGK